MAIQVQPRVQAPQRQQQPERDIFDKIMLGLQAANSVLGIKGQLEQSEMREFERERITQQDRLAEQARQQQLAQRQQLTPMQQATLASQGFGLTTGAEGPQPADAISFQTLSGQQMFARPPDFAAKTEKAALAAAQKIAQEERSNKNKLEKGLRGEYEKASDETIKSLRNFRKLKSVVRSAKNTGADDVAIVFNFMKTLDPGSVVRENEFATAEQTAGLPQQVVNTYNRLLEGNRLTPAQREQFLQSAARMMEPQIQSQMDINERFSILAERAGADVEDVISPQFDNAMDEINEILQGQTGQGMTNQPVTPPTIADLIEQERLRRAGQTAGGR